MKVVKFDKSKFSEWNEFVTNSKNGLFLFNRTYMDYHNERFTDHSLMLYKNNKLVALLPANEKNQKIFSHAGLTFGGLIMSYGLKAADTISIFEKIIEYCKSTGIDEIFYKAIPPIFHRYPAQEDLYALFRQDATFYRRDISTVINLSNPIKFSETKRQAVTKCIQSGVQISENENFTEYWKLLTEVLNKFETNPVHSIDEIHFLKSKFPQNIRLFEARLNEELLAGVVIYDYENVTHTQYMANSEVGRKLGALDFINFKLITEYFKDRKYYSLGTSNENEGKHLNEGLIQQKEMMGGRGVVNDFYKIQII